MDLSALPRTSPAAAPDEESFDGIRTALKLIRQYDPRLHSAGVGEVVITEF